MSVLSIAEWAVWAITLLAGLWFAVGIRQTAIRRTIPPTWPTLILSMALVVYPIGLLFIPFSKLHILWLVPVTWVLALIAGISYIPVVSQVLIWPAYLYARAVMFRTGVSLSSPSLRSPWAGRKLCDPPDISGFFDSLSHEASITDNFEYIAFNMAILRHTLEADHADRFSDHDTLLVACGVLDTIMHIRGGHFTVQDVKHALVRAKQGQCRFGLKPVSIDEVEASYPKVADLFLNYTLQIEAMCFCAIERFVDSEGMSEKDIVSSVIDKAIDIRRILQTPKDVLARSNVAGSTRQLTTAFMDSPDFADLRKEIGIQ